MAAKQSNPLGVIPIGLGIGLAISIVTTLLGTAIGAWLISSEKIGEGSTGYITVLILLLSSILGAWFAIQTIKQNRLLFCLSSGGIYFLTLLAITALFFGGMYSGVGESALVISAGAFSVALLGLREQKRTKKRKKK